jgi:CRISPR/Cas system CSM-associated protein Csm2 small subunit
VSQLKKQKSTVDLKQRQVQKIYKQILKRKKESTENEAKSTIIFIGIVVVASFILTWYEIIFH